MRAEVFLKTEGLFWLTSTPLLQLNPVVQTAGCTRPVMLCIPRAVSIHSAGHHIVLANTKA